jgi:hypothetical protein
MKRGEFFHHLVVLIGFVRMNGLCMLSEVVETGELLGAVTRKRTFTSMFTTGVSVSVCRHRSGVVGSTGTAGEQGQAPESSACRR